MNYQDLKNEIVNDPLGLGYSTMTDAEVASALNNTPANQVVQTFANAKTVLATLGANAGATFLDALEAASASNSAVKWALMFIKSVDGIDVGNTETRNMLDQLAAANVLDPASVATIKALAEKTVSRAEYLGLGFVKPGDVEYARTI
ncbi:MAG: hypothetical protein D6698_15585 [Gammaproteobacteria bacterium]|nr:MAG: hypothetical protein D6698_15585 [Gammaproteobacteria bacterium]